MEAITDVIATLMRGFFRPASALVWPGDRIYWPYLLSALLLAAVAWGMARGRTRTLGDLWRYLWPRDVWLHPSAVLDYKFLVINWSLWALLIAPWMASTFVVANTLRDGLEAAFGPADAIGPVTRAVTISYTVCIVLAADLRRYVTHRFMHRVPVLWELHKVHHSAQRLTPITLYRVHPLERIVSTTGDAVFTGVVAGAFTFLFSDGLSAYTVLGVSVGRFVFNTVGANLRHSHVWLSFGRPVEHVIMSPAQHQIHHSNEPRHYDKNFGSGLSIWDWMFGTLYIPQDEEKIAFGLAGGEDSELQTLWRLYTRPLVRAFGLLRGRS